MKLIKPSVEVINEPDIMKRIEICGRVAYQSEDKMCEGSDEKFFKSLVGRGHESVLEHSRIVVSTNTPESTKALRYLITEYENMTGFPALIRNCGSEDEEYNYDDTIWSSNLRAWRSIAKRYLGEPIMYNLFNGNPLFYDIHFTNVMDFLYNNNEYDANVIPCDPLCRDAHRYMTFKVTCSRGTANEFVRHRLGSFTQSSTRYINYSDDVPYVEAWWMQKDHDLIDENTYLDILVQEEHFYNKMFELSKPQPQKSRAVLPNETAATLCITGTVEYFKNVIIPLRTASGAHPDAQIIANLINEKIIAEDKNVYGHLDSQQL